jgi:hypothetical protein
MGKGVPPFKPFKFIFYLKKFKKGKFIFLIESYQNRLNNFE